MPLAVENVIEMRKRTAQLTGRCTLTPSPFFERDFSLITCDHVHLIITRCSLGQHESEKKVNIAERLERLRAAKTLSWGELCADLDIKRSMLHYLRNGDRGPSAKLSRRIEKAEKDAGLQPPDTGPPVASNSGKTYPESLPTAGRLREESSSYGTKHPTPHRDPSHMPRDLENNLGGKMEALESRMERIENALAEVLALMKGKGK